MQMCSAHLFSLNLSSAVQPFASAFGGTTTSSGKDELHLFRGAGLLSRPLGIALCCRYGQRVGLLGWRPLSRIEWPVRFCRSPGNGWLRLCAGFWQLQAGLRFRPIRSAAARPRISTRSSAPKQFPLKPALSPYRTEGHLFDQDCL